MAKDPALLWYPGDWTQGTQLFTFEEKGAYMTLLMIQFETGSLSIDDIKYVLGNRFDTIWSRICTKFKQDNDGRFYQWRIREEKVKRVKFTESRKKNLSKPHMDDHMKPHMEDHMENENRNIDYSTITTNTKYCTEIFQSSEKMLNLTRVFRDNKIKTEQENIQRLVGIFATEIDAKEMIKPNVKEFLSHFISWVKINHDKHKPKVRQGLQHG